MGKRVIFSEETIHAIKSFAEEGQHTIAETCNKFNISFDVMKRLGYEHKIKFCRVHSARTWEDITKDQEEEIIALFKCTNTPLMAISKEVKLDYLGVEYILRKHFSEEEINTREFKLKHKKPMHGKQKSEIVSDGNGYLITRKPDWYTGRARSDYIFYHSVVMCEALGITEIPKGFAVHHIDHNPLNNDISNLALLAMGAHSKLHAIETKMMKQGSETIRNGVGNDGSETPDLDRPEE